MTPLLGKELAKLVESKGWPLLRVNGSHHVYSRPGVTVRLSIPVHGSSKLKFGLKRHFAQPRWRGLQSVRIVDLMQLGSELAR